jgi:hypothetical protein
MVGARTERWLPWTVALVIAAILVWARFASEGIREAGDGVQHHMIARYSWKHPELLLDQWGKPMFTLLASPFAQFGYNAMAVFNALLALACVALSLKLLRRSGTWTLVAYPAALMLAPQYAQLVIDGMTEILFSTMALFCVRLLADERYRMAAIVGSLTPLCRPEYIVFLPFVAGWLAWNKRFTTLPWCALGIAVYSVSGWLHTGDPLLWWHGDPYGSGESIYGKGDPWRFIMDAPRAFGWAVVAAFILSLVIWPWLWWKDTEERHTHRLLLVMAALPALGIVAVHAYLRWSGTHGSAGLTRVLVTALPLAALFSLFTLGRGLKRLSGSAVPGFVLASASVLCGVFGLRAEGPLRQDPDVDQTIINEACDVIARERKPTDRVFTTHPYVPFRVGLDGFDPARSRMLWGFHDERAESGPALPGDIIFWDAALGPNECGVQLGTLLDHPGLTVLKVAVPAQGHFVLGDRSYEVWVFQRYPARRTTVRDTLGSSPGIPDMHVRFDTVPCAEPGIWCSDREFPLTLDGMPLPQRGALYEDWSVEVDVHYMAEGEDASFVFKRNRGDILIRYDDRPLREGPNRFSFRLPVDTLQVEQNLYIYAHGERMMRGGPIHVVRTTVWQERQQP